MKEGYIRVARDISKEDYKDGIFVIEKSDMTRYGFWLIPNSGYAKWYSSLENAIQGYAELWEER